MTDETDNGILPATLTIELAKPVKIGSTEYAQLTLREPRTGEVLMAEQQLRRGASPETLRLYYLHLIGKVADVPVPALNLMPITVYNQAVAFLENFSPAGRETGESFAQS